MYTIKKQTATGANTEQDIVGAFHELAMVYERYRRQIQTTAAVIIGALILIGGYSVYQEYRDKKASAILAQAMDAYRASQQGGDEKSLDLFKKVRSTYGGTLSADIAQYYIGNCLAGLGRNQEAFAAYQQLVNRSVTDKKLLGLAYQRIGYVQASMGSAEESLKAFEQAELLLGPGVATIEAAHLYETRGKADEAKKKYSAVAPVLPGSVPAPAKSDVPQNVRPAGAAQ